VSPAASAPPADRRQLIDGVLDIARRAGAEILDVYRTRDRTHAAKADSSPLTLADLRSHRLIVRALAELTPGLPVLSEEGAMIGFAERASWRRHWLVDPLDGTKEFLSGNGEFTVNIALIGQHEPQLGVVYIPVLDTLYWGGPGLGAWRRQGVAEPVPIQVHRHAAAPVRVVGSRSHRGDSLDGFLARLGPHLFIPVGSSVKFCMVAEGTADVYPRLGPTSEWDTAAAHAVVTGAGGFVVTAAGEPMTYNGKADLRNPDFVVYADPDRDWLALLSRAATARG
jgi:3'(2'), 5'-bisphosphate nucleotidase